MLRVTTAIALIIGIMPGLATAANAQTFGGSGSTLAWNPNPGVVSVLASPPFPGSIDLSTAPGGVNWDNPLDINLVSPWTFSAGPDTGGAVSIGGYDHYLVPPELPDAATSVWFGVWGGNNSEVTFSETFSLAGARLDTARLSGVWGVFGRPSPPATLLLNGTEIGALDMPGSFPTALTSFAVDPSLFLSGQNTLSIEFPGATYPGQGPDDVFRVEATLTATPVPEPASLTMLALGLAGLAKARRRRWA